MFIDHSNYYYQLGVFEIGRVSNRIHVLYTCVYVYYHTSGEHIWESHVTFSVVHTNSALVRVLFLTLQALVYSPVSTMQVQLQI